MPPAMHHPCTAASVGFEIEWSLAKVLPNVPIIRTSATVSHTRPRAPSWLGLRHRRPVEPEPGAERLALGADEHDPHVVVGVGGVERGVELVAQTRR